MASSPTQYPESYGWDTVFALTLPAATKLLAALPPSPTFTATTPVTGGTATLSWNFADWDITNVLGGAMIEMSMHFGANSSLTMPKAIVADPIALDRSGIRCKIEFEASFVPGTGKLMPVTGTDWATVDVVVPVLFNGTAKQSLQTILQDWIASDDAQALFATELLTLDMSSEVENEVPWLRPTLYGFAGGTLASGAKAIGIMTMAAGSAVGGAARAPGRLALSPAAIPDNAEAGYYLSRDLVMANMFIPAIIANFSNDKIGKISDYDVAASDSRLTNRAPLAFTIEMEEQRRGCTIEAGKLSAWIDGRYLYLSIEPLTAETSIAGLLVDAVMREKFTLSLEPLPNKSDSSILTLKSIDPQITLAHRNSTTVTVSTLSIAAALAIVGAVLAVVSPKGFLRDKLGLSAEMAKIWARVIVAAVGVVGGVLIGGIPFIVAAAREGRTEEIPVIDALLNTLLARIQWPEKGKTRFLATEGSFANGILMAVKLDVA